MRSKYLKQQNKYTNPFFKKKKKRAASKVNWKVRFLFFEIILLGAGLIWFFYFSSVFNIVIVDVRGTQRISQDEVVNIAFNQVEEKRLLIGSQKNIFFFDIGKLEDSLRNRYLLKEIWLKKDIPDKIIITIVEKDYSAIWQEDDRYYYISETGRIINKADLEDKERYPLINNLGKNSASNNGAKDEVERIDYILKLFKKFKDKKTRITNNGKWFSIDSFILDDMEYTVQMVIKICNTVTLEKSKIETSKLNLDVATTTTTTMASNFETKEDCEKGPVVYFNLQENVDKQVAKLLVLIKEKLRSDLDGKEYIDLRYGDKIYYK